MLELFPSEHHRKPSSPEPGGLLTRYQRKDTIQKEPLFALLVYRMKNVKDACLGEPVESQLWTYDLKAAANWLKQSGIDSVAMESDTCNFCAPENGEKLNE